MYNENIKENNQDRPQPFEIVIVSQITVEIDKYNHKLSVTQPYGLKKKIKMAEKF